MKRTKSDGTRTRAIGVVVPVHNEEALLGPALESLENAFAVLCTKNISLGVAVVLDACSDRSAQVVKKWISHLRSQNSRLHVSTPTCDVRNVGSARALGCSNLLNNWDEIRAGEIWLATTDADSRVPPHWLAAQVLAHEGGADLWTGRVEVSEWGDHDEETISTWTALYDAEEYPVHGASMGFNAWHYMKVGGFPPWKCGEDREIFRQLVDSGAHWSHNSSIRVVTSSRRFARAPGGFAHVLELIESKTDRSEVSDTR